MYVSDYTSQMVATAIGILLLAFCSVMALIVTCLVGYNQDVSAASAALLSNLRRRRVPIRSDTKEKWRQLSNGDWDERFTSPVASSLGSPRHTNHVESTVLRVARSFGVAPSPNARQNSPNQSPDGGLGNGGTGVRFVSTRIFGTPRDVPPQKSLLSNRLFMA